MKWKRVAAGSAASALAMSAAGVTPAGAVVSTPQPRITSIGGINLVPTPSYLGIHGLVEQAASSCTIGAGCASRTWQKNVGADANNPTQVFTFQANVGILPTTRLASADMTVLRQQFQTFQANSGFVGQVRQYMSGRRHILTISGYFDQTLDDWVRIVQVRQGRRTVFIGLNLDDRTVSGQLPAAANIPRLVRKAKAVFGRSWAQVPNTVLPD